MMKRRAKAQEEFIVDAAGRKKAVILNMNTYKELLEDLDDLTIIAERQGEVTYSLKDVEERLKKRGLL